MLGASIGGMGSLDQVKRFDPKIAMIAAIVMCNPAVTTHAQAFELFGKCIIGPCDDADAKADAALIDPKRYEILFGVERGNDDVEIAIKAASELWRGRNDPVGGSAGVISRARGDYRRILAALYNEGYYGGSISIRVSGRQASELPVGAAFDSGSTISVNVDPGPPYRFGRADVIGAAAPTTDKNDRVPAFADVGFASGLPAEAGAVGKAVKLARDGWRQQGYALAEVIDRSATANHPGQELNVSIEVEPGQRAVYGDLSVAGTERMDPEFVARQTGLKPGEEYDPDDLEKARKRLERLGVFSTQKIVEGENLNDDGSLPLSLTFKERKLRRIGAGATISSIDGVGLETFWLHRNLFGKAERLRLDAKVSGLGSTFDYQKFNYHLGAAFTKPGVFTPDTDLNFNLYATRQVFDDYIETFGGGSVFLTHFLSDEITLSGGGFAEYYEFDDDGATQDFETIGLTGSLEYDTRDNALDPTSGLFISGDLKPFYEFNYQNFGLRSEVEGRYYLSLSKNDRAVLATRMMIGSVSGPPRDEVPDNILFFAGGGGSVRGYGFNNIGIVEADGDVTGGLSKIEGSIEARFKITEKFGAVAFADAAIVSNDSIPSFDEDLKAGVGVGIRYYTGLGPIRLDVAIPLNRGADDPSFGFYAGIGQAF